MRFHRSIAAVLAVGVATVAHVPTARADVNVRTASGTAKGITGGALLGAEAVLLTEAALDVQPVWAYIVGGGVGAAAGGVGGYFLEQEVSAKTSMLLLASGMLLVIPTAVAVASARAYEPPADFVEDRGPVDVPVAEPPAPDPLPAPRAPDTAGQTSQNSLRKPRRVSRGRTNLMARLTPPALMKLDEGYLSLSVPAVQVRDVYTRQELLQYGFRQETELSVSLLSYTF